MKKIIIDTDTGSDDAVALLMALREPSVQVVAFTTVSGNIEVNQATYNCLQDVYKRQAIALHSADAAAGYTGRVLAEKKGCSPPREAVQKAGTCPCARTAGPAGLVPIALLHAAPPLFAPQNRCEQSPAKSRRAVSLPEIKYNIILEGLSGKSNG